MYLRAVIDGKPAVTLVASRTKIAPLRRVSLPRLELCAATLLAKLAEHIEITLDLRPSAVHLWTDSTIILGWVRGHPAKWTTYVANRVSEIQRTSPDSTWRHVPGRENPANCASRGVSPGELLTHSLWWRGPSYLREDRSAWLVDAAAAVTGDLPERPPPPDASLPSSIGNRRSCVDSRASGVYFVSRPGSGAGGIGVSASLPRRFWSLRRLVPPYTVGSE